MLADKKAQLIGTFVVSLIILFLIIFDLILSVNRVDYEVFEVDIAIKSLITEFEQLGKDQNAR